MSAHYVNVLIVWLGIGAYLVLLRPVHPALMRGADPSAARFGTYIVRFFFYLVGSILPAILIVWAVEADVSTRRFAWHAGAAIILFLLFWAFYLTVENDEIADNIKKAKRNAKRRAGRKRSQAKRRSQANDP